MEICVIAFKNNISERIAKLLSIKNKYYLISTGINPGAESKIACGLGNSYCNLLTYLIASKNNNYAIYTHT